MFRLFQSAPYRDSQLGEFRRSGGHWKGHISLAPCGTFCLALAGTRASPDAQALQLANELPRRFLPLMPQIQTGLFEHYTPYQEAIAAGEEADSSCPTIANAEAVWQHVQPAHVLFEPFKNVWRIEIAFTTAWDIEHMVAAIFDDNWRFVGFNGSVRGQ